jgi:hypothetical protein
MKTLHKIKEALNRKAEFDAKQPDALQVSPSSLGLEEINEDSAMEMKYEYFEFTKDEIQDIQSALKEEINSWKFEFLPEYSQEVQVYRILSPQTTSIPMIELSQGLESKEVEIVEISESGSVNELRVRNHSLKNLLIYEGSLLQGEKQNRIVNATLLLKPQSETVIPVSCVEQGRWSKKSQGFSKPNYDATSSMRYRLKKDILSAKKGHYSDQSNIWKEVKRFSEKESVSNQTSDFADHYEKSQKKDHVFKEGLKFKSQGIMARNASSDFTDFVNDGQAFEHILERISKGYEFENNEKNENPKNPDAYLIEALGEEVKDVYAHNSVGLGFDLRIETESHYFNSLLLDDSFVAISIARKPAFDYFD